ncbi:hypothetical protein RAH41_04260 [Gottfriedia acidiceleris]|uniref:hypothetical protein n=1 Tax=Gottfriedia acidiceleris TaxID=371036 RepID=UPI002F2637F4
MIVYFLKKFVYLIALLFLFIIINIFLFFIHFLNYKVTKPNIPSAHLYMKAKLLIILIATIMNFSVCIPKSSAVIALEGNGTHCSIIGATLWANPVTAKKIGYRIKKKITRTELLQIKNP